MVKKRGGRTVLVSVGIIVVALAHFLSAGGTRALASANREYKVLKVGPAAAFQQAMNAQSSQGWELVGLGLDGSGGPIAVLRK